LVWGVSQILSIVSCGAATAEAVLTGGLAIPLAYWACGSVVLNGIAKLEESIKKNDGSCGGSTGTCPIGGEGSCLQHLNNANSILLDVQSCFAPPNVSECAQAVGLRLVDEGVKSLLDPEKICSKPTNNTEYCYGLRDLCRSYGTELHPGLCFCWATGYSPSEETKFTQTCETFRGGEWNRVGGCSKPVGCTLQCWTDGEYPRD